MDHHQIARAGRIVYLPERCTGCGACELSCSLAHEGSCHPGLSRIHFTKDSFNGNHTIEVCAQCFSPGCYFACSTGAINIDSETGARYIDEEKCVGCGRCASVCPLMPEKQVIRFKIEKGRKLFFKCDLCKDRVEGPICVQNCPALALTYLKASDKP